MPSRCHSRYRTVGFWFALSLWAFVAISLFGGASGRASAALTPDSPEVKAAVEKAIGFLRTGLQNSSLGHRSFAAATMMRAGVPPEDPYVSAELNRILERFKDGNYAKLADANAFHNNYEPAADLMALCIARRWQIENNKKPDAYTAEIQTVVDYLIAKQNPDGNWDYFDRPKDQGDTSQVQFVLLALWSAVDEGFEIPGQVWENAAKWLVETQDSSGGFSYHPRGNGNQRDHGVEHGTTVAGVTGLLIAGIHLYSQDEVGRRISRGKSDEGEPAIEEPVIEAGGPGDVRSDGTAKAALPEKKGKRGAGAKSVALGQINQAVDRGVDYLVNDYRMQQVQRFDLYYRYGVERMTAMRFMETIGSHDWYQDGANMFLAEQDQSDGSWSSSYDGKQAGTCFGILFLTRATWRKIQHNAPPGLGKGQMQGKRGGLNIDPSLTQSETGEIKREEHKGPLEDFLNDLLSHPESKIAPELGKKMIEDYKSNPAKRAELIGQKDKLKELMDLPNDDARIAALWALGRCEDLGLAPLMIKALGDNNVDVSVEARNSLCMLSRRPLGEGLPAHPWANLSEDANEQQKQDEFLKWRLQVQDRWKQWYARVRPYDQRDDLSDLGAN